MFYYVYVRLSLLFSSLSLYYLLLLYERLCKEVVLIAMQSNSYQFLMFPWHVHAIDKKEFKSKIAKLSYCSLGSHFPRIMY